MMLSRLQQALTLGMIALSVLWAGWWLSAGRVGLALAGVVVLTCGHAFVLGAEFLLLRQVNRHDPVPAASAGQLLRAWWGEVRAAPLVFCWRQPFRSRRWPDHLPAAAAGRRGLVLVHGFVCNRGLWNRWLERLHADGVPFVAVDLEPVFGSIDDYARTIDDAVAALRACTGLAPVVVAHSMGGLALRGWWARQGDDAALHHAITIGTPHRGTWLARFAFTPNGRQMQQGSAWLRSLQAGEPPGRAGRFTCFHGNCDNIVFPTSTGALPGADNRHLPGIAHVHMVDRPEPFAEMLRWLRA